MWPWDEEQTAVDALRESSAPAAATGGAGDWMSAIPMILGAGASLASPNMANAGNAVMQMGDYFRRQRGEDLAQQRYQSGLAQQQRTNELAQQHLKMQQQQAALKEQRRQDTMRNFQQMVDLRAARTGMDPREAFSQMQGMLPQMETESLPQAVPLINELNTAMRGQQQAEAALPYYIPGPQREQLASNAGWGIEPITQGMERQGYGIGNMPGGDETLTKRQERSRDHAKAALEEVSYAARERALRDPAFAQTLMSNQLVEMGLMNKLDSRPDLADRAATLLSDGKFPYAGDFIKAGGSQAVLALNDAMAKLEGEQKAGVNRIETPSLAARAAAIEDAKTPIEIRRSEAIARNNANIELAKNDEEARRKLKREQYVEGERMLPNGQIVPGVVATPIQIAAGQAGGRVTQADKRALDSAQKTRGLIVTLDELSKPIITAKTGAGAAAQGAWYRTQPWLGIQNTDVRAYQGAVDEFVGNFASTFADEGGNRSNKDIERAKALAPALDDTVYTRDLRIRILHDGANRAERITRMRLQGLPAATVEEEQNRVRAVIDGNIETLNKLRESERRGPAPGATKDPLLSPLFGR